jgi:hypothetical protein
MKLSTLSLFAVILLFLSFFSVTNVFAQSGKLLTVNNVTDTHDANVGDTFCADANGNCTLRAAIEEANATSAQDAVNFALPNPSIIDLTLGELTISSSIYITGPGARKLTVQRSSISGTPQFRIFAVQPSASPSPVPTIRGMSIKNGNVSGDGGAIYTLYQSSLQLIDVWITNNTAAGSAGAIFSAGTLSVTRSLISSNTANGLFAGGIVNIGRQGASVITNSTLTNNVGGQGGAIYNTGRLILANDTISHNSARNTGSSVTNDPIGTINVLNTIVGMDNSPSVSSLQGAFTSFGNNLITDARNSTGFTNGTNNDQVSDNNAINPLLGNLADNGGQTDTRALLDGSPAINRANNCVYNRTCVQPLQNIYLSTDQRTEFGRRGGLTVDIGAYEVQTVIVIGDGGIGNFSLNNRMGGIPIILTNARTNEKKYKITNPFGNFFFDGINFNDVYILEQKGKRAGQSFLTILDFEDIPILVPSIRNNQSKEFNIVLNK